MTGRKKAEMSGAAINDLPDSAFAYIEPGGSKDDEGKTVPRSLRHFPIHDAAHVRNALARLSTSPFEDKARPKVEAAAKKMGIGEPADEGKGKAMSEAASDLATGANTLACLYTLLACEADEPDQLAVLQQAATSLLQWMSMEQREVGTAGDLDNGDYADAPYAMKARAFAEMKAEPMDTGHLDRWLKGEIPRRMLAIPYGGPIPGNRRQPLGTDIDGEWFSERTDLYGGHKALTGTRERLVDFHHRQDPTGVMGDAILGKAIIDEKPSIDGLWVDLWANAGEERLRLVGQLEKRARLYGSSESAPGWQVSKATGEILYWPWVRQTISTSPQNTLAVMPPLKALLTANLPLREVGLAAVKAALVGLGSTVADLTLAEQRLTPAAKPGNDDDAALLYALRDARSVIRAARDVLPAI
jgi:hypothetical protein